MKKYFSFTTLKKTYKRLIALLCVALLCQWGSGFFETASFWEIILDNCILIFVYIAGSVVADWIKLRNS
ncbi:MAG: hypothetical protein Q4B85_03585 [Lachnospiraceae bacterium]|nr:hypothetical protein [Lachnospiraceae bacterium]